MYFGFPCVCVILHTIHSVQLPDLYVFLCSLWMNKHLKQEHMIYFGSTDNWCFHMNLYHHNVIQSAMKPAAVRKYWGNTGDALLNEGIERGRNINASSVGAMMRITAVSAGYWPAESSLSGVQSLMAWPRWQPAEWEVWVEPLRPQTNQWVSLWQVGDPNNTHTA